MPPSYWKLVSKPSPRSSRKSMRRPLVRKAISRKRCSRTVRSYSMRLEDLEVGQEGDPRAAAIGLAALLERRGGRAALVGLRPLVAVTPDRQLQPLRKRVDHRHTHAVQAAGHLVATAVAELAAGVQHGQDDLGGRATLLLVHGNRDAAAVVADRDAVVRVDGDLDRVGLAGQRLVDRVVHDLVDEVVKTPCAGGPDVHAGTLAHRLETLEDGDVLRVIAPIARLAVTARPRGFTAVFVLLRVPRQTLPSVARPALRMAAPP